MGVKSDEVRRIEDSAWGWRGEMDDPAQARPDESMMVPAGRALHLDRLPAGECHTRCGDFVLILERSQRSKRRGARSSRRCSTRTTTVRSHRSGDSTKSAIRPSSPARSSKRTWSRVISRECTSMRLRAFELESKSSFRWSPRVCRKQLHELTRVKGIQDNDMRIRL